MQTIVSFLLACDWAPVQVVQPPPVVEKAAVMLGLPCRMLTALETAPVGSEPSSCGASTVMLGYFLFISVLKFVAMSFSVELKLSSVIATVPLPSSFAPIASAASVAPTTGLPSVMAVRPLTVPAGIGTCQDTIGILYCCDTWVM